MINTTRQRQHGLTLVELVTAMAVASVLMAVAVPSFRGLALNTQRSSVMTGIGASILFARSETLKRGITITICPSSNGTDCSSGAAPEWNQGWVLFEDGNGNQQVDSGETLLRVIRFDSPSFSMTGANGLQKGITFLQGGFPSATGQLDFCETDGDHSRTVNLNVVGRITIDSIDGGCGSS